MFVRLMVSCCFSYFGCSGADRRSGCRDRRILIENGFVHAGSRNRNHLPEANASATFDSDQILSESSWDAAEQLRGVRQKIVDRATEMGAIEGSLRTIGYQCYPEAPQSISIVRGGSPESKFAAKCYLVADFQIREAQDNEALIAVCQAQLDELTSLMPKPDANRRVEYYTSLASGLTAQQLESPAVFFVASVSDADRATAFKIALDAAKQETADCPGRTRRSGSSHRFRCNSNPSYVSSRPKHPLESEIYRNDNTESVGMYADAVDFSVKLVVNARFQLAK